MNPSEAFEPQNELEQNLLDTLEGRMEEDDFLASLMDAQIYMPVQDEPDLVDGQAPSTTVQPLVLQDDRNQPVLVLFTSPARAREFVQEFPGYGGGLLTEFSWVLRHIGTPAAIIINPDDEIGFDLEADSVAELMAGVPPEQC